MRTGHDLELLNLCSNWNLDAIEKFLDIHKSTDLSETIQTLLNHASQDGQLKVFELIHSKGHDIRTYTQISAENAARNGHIKIIKFLLDNKLKFHNSISMHACVARSGDIDTLDFLHQSFKLSKSELNFIMATASQCGHTHLVQHLIAQHKADAFDRAIIEAANNGHRDLVKFLLDHNIRITNKTSVNTKAPHYHIFSIIDKSDNISDDQKAYKDKETVLLKYAHPLVHVISLKDLNKYSKLSTELKGSMMFILYSRQMGANYDINQHMLANFLSEDKVDANRFNLKAAMDLNFPTDEDIEKVRLKCSKLAKWWIALLEKNQLTV